MNNPQSTADALQAEVRDLASSALNEPKPRAALGALCMWLRRCFPVPQQLGHPFQALCALLRRGRSEGALDCQLRLILADAYQRAVVASGLPLLPMLTLKAA